MKFLIALFRWFLNLFRRKSPQDFKPGEWAKFVKSFHFDRLPTSQKGVAFSQIMSFRK